MAHLRYIPVQTDTCTRSQTRKSLTGAVYPSGCLVPVVSPEFGKHPYRNIRLWVRVPLQAAGCNTHKTLGIHQSPWKHEWVTEYAKIGMVSTSISLLVP